jgi:hypothetical protein
MKMSFARTDGQNRAGDRLAADKLSASSTSDLTTARSIRHVAATPLVYRAIDD